MNALATAELVWDLQRDRARRATLAPHEQIGTSSGTALYPLTPDLVDGEADGVHVLALFTVAPPVLLHERHQEAAGHLGILGVIVFFQQRDLVLGVYPERV